MINEVALMRRLTLKIVPLLMVCYFIAYLERVNVGFAALTMNQSLGFSAATFGIGAGMFSVGYLLFEVPLSALFNRFGARWTFSRTMLAWGLISCAMAFIWNDKSYFILRFLLGIAEAGFSPGVIVYLSRWFPQKYRGRIISLFMLSLPLSNFVGAPISGYLVGLPSWSGFHGWQLMFIVEGAPALIMAVVLPFLMKEHPSDDKRLTPMERDWLVRQTARPADALAGPEKSFLETLYDRRVILLAIGYLGVLLVHNSLSIWMPQMIRSEGLSIRATGVIVMLPYLAGMIGMLVWARHSDRTGERKWHTIVAMLVAASGLSTAAIVTLPVLKIAAVCIALLGSFSALSVFWTLPTSFLAGSGAVGGVALISSVGQLAGLVGPALIGISKDRTGSFAAGLLGISLICVFAASLILVADRNRKGCSIPTPQT